MGCFNITFAQHKMHGESIFKLLLLRDNLGILQLLCEELEYADLLEKADGCQDRFNRMVYVAAFAVSAYCSTNSR